MGKTNTYSNMPSLCDNPRTTHFIDENTEGTQGRQASSKSGQSSGSGLAESSSGAPRKEVWVPGVFGGEPLAAKGCQVRTRQKQWGQRRWHQLEGKEVGLLQPEVQRGQGTCPRSRSPPGAGQRARGAGEAGRSWAPTGALMQGEPHTL